MTIKRKDTPESRVHWAFAERTAAEVRAEMAIEEARRITREIDEQVAERNRIAGEQL